jgi:hypothetical protein
LVGLAWSWAARAQPTNCKELVPNFPNIPSRPHHPIESGAAQEAKATLRRLPAADSLDETFACLPASVHFDTPHSAWLDNDRSIANAVLSKTSADMLIVPVQVQGYGLDPIERSIISADLAHALAANAVVADPFLVDRSFGLGRRRITAPEVDETARRLGASRIVTTFVGQDLHHAMVLTIQVREVPGNGGGQPASQWQKDWRSITFTDEEPPALVFHRMLPEILASLPALAGPRLTTPHAQEIQNSQRVHATLDPAKIGGDRPAKELLTLLATLSGLQDSGIGSRLFVKALVTSLSTYDTSSRSKWLQAYVLMNLGRRPAALARLAGDATPAFTTLRALLDGNLPATRASIGKVSDPFEHFLLSIAAHDLELSYGEKTLTQPHAAAAVFGRAYTDWGAIVAVRSMERDPWKVAPALAIKTFLDAAFPVPDLSASSFLKGSRVVRNEPPDEVDIDLVSVRHLDRVANELPAVDCCIGPKLGTGGWEMLELMQSLLESRIAKALYLESGLQGRPTDAIRDLSRYEPKLEGHPVISMARANAMVSMYSVTSGNEKAGWESRANAASVLAAYLSQGQTPLAWQAIQSMAAPPQGLGLYLLQAYSHDYPQHAYWQAALKGLSLPADEQLAFEREALAYSRDNLLPLQQLARIIGAAELPALADSLGNRFAGHPALRDFLAFAHKNRQGESPEEALVRLRAAVDQGARDFFTYLQLGDAEIRIRGDYKAASQAFLRYPGFHDSNSANVVGESNYAEMFGSRLYALGRPELAKPFYQTSANLHTGSESSLLSELRLRIMDQDYARALMAAQKSALSYSDAFTYRDYLSWLHVLGRGAEAWQGFTQVATAFDDPQVWISALVGHRHDAMTDVALQKWLLQPYIRDAHFDGRRFAPYFAVIWYTTDRTSPKDVGDFLDRLDWPNGTRISEDGFHVERPSLENPDVRRIQNWSGLQVGNPAKLVPGSPFRSEYSLFIEGYASLRAGQFRAALDAFLAMASHYPVEPSGNGWPTYALPYIAYAAAQSGDPTGVERFVNNVNAPAFDTWLAKAFFAGMHKDPEGAEAALNSAFRAKQFAQLGINSTRPILVDYQYAEACEWLYQFIGDRRFVATLLDWVTRFQRIEPTYAWSYAMEFQYASDPKARTRALGMTMYLDPLSERIKSASKGDRDAANAWLATNNPFMKRRTKDDMTL